MKPAQTQRPDAEVPGLSPAFRTLQWAALFTIVMAAVWLMFGTPAMDPTAGLAEAAWSSDAATQ